MSNVVRSKLSAAIARFRDRKLSLGQAARLAGLSRLRFMDALAEEGIVVFDYDESALASELEGVAQLGRNLRDRDTDRPLEDPQIEIATSEASENAEDETAYLLGTPANRERLLRAIENIARNDPYAVLTLNDDLLEHNPELIENCRHLLKEMKAGHPHSGRSQEDVGVKKP